MKRISTPDRDDPLGSADEELRFHLERQVEELIEAGWDPDSARAEARRRFGDPDRVLETLDRMGRRRQRMTRSAEWLGQIGADVGFAFRQVRRRPAFAAAAVIVISLGIGISAAVFAVLDATWLRPLPFPEPERLVVLEDGQDQPGYPASLPEFRDWERDGDFLSASAAVTRNDRTLLLGDVPERVSIGLVAGDLAGVSGLPPIIGRSFNAEEAAGRSEARVLLVDEDFWRGRLAADPGVVGRVLTVDGSSSEVVGVMPRSAKLLFGASEVQFWAPLADAPSLSRGLHMLTVVARLAPGVDLARGTDRTAAMSAALLESAVTTHSVSIKALRDELFAETRSIVLVLTGAVAIVLIVVCANLAHLFIVRAWARSREFAVRGALGAARWRLARQVVTESVLLGAMGAVGGILLARFVTGWVARASGNEVVAALAAGSGARVVTFSVVASIVVGALFGWLPAARVGASDPGRALSGSREEGASAGRTRLRRALVVSEVALSVVLLVGAGLLLRTVGRLVNQDAGFSAPGVLTARITLPSSRYGTPEAQLAFWTGLLERVRALPGVQQAGLGSHLPLLGDTNGGFQIVGREFPDDASPHSKKRFVGPGYFDAMGIQVLRGRDILDSDRRGGQEVAVVSASLAARYWPGEDAVGKRIRFLWQTEGEQEIVGVVADVRSDALEMQEEGTIYLAADQIGVGSMSVVIRTSGSPETLVEPVRRIVREIDPQQAVHDVQTLEAIVRDSLSNRATMMQLLAVFGALALLLAGVGVYAVAAQSVLARRRDIGVRLAIGASPPQVLRAVLRDEALPVVAGLVLGLAASLPAARALASLLYGVGPADPATLGGVALVLVVAGGLALLGPSLRAVRVDPATALRGD